MSTRTILSVVSFIASSEAEGAVRRVPQDHSTIQAAINAAQNGDTVLVSRGTYPGGLSIANKSITLASNFINTGDPNDITLTIIDGGSTGLNIQASAGPSTTIRGLTFRNGGHQINVAARRANILNSRFINAGTDQVSFTGGGGLVRDCFFDNAGDDGIDIDGASDPTIENNTILNSRNDGIEMRLHDYTGATLTTTIRNNFISGAREDGIQLIDYPGLSSRLIRIERNVIVNSAMVGLGSMADGISNENFAGAPMQEEVQIINNTFSGNLYGLTGGDKMLVMNNIFEHSPQIGVKRVAGGSVVTENDFWNNGTEHTGSNITMNTTLFTDCLLDANYELASGSPCINAGAASISFNGHVVNAPPFSGTAPDLGAKERGSTPGLPTITVTATDASAGEGGANPGAFSVSRSGSTSGPLTVTYQVGGTASPGQDYTALSGSVTIAAGSATRVVTVTPIDDTVLEPNEQVVLTLSAAPGYVVGSPGSASLTITDNEPTTGSRSFQDGVLPTASYAGTRDTYISEVDLSGTFGTWSRLRADGDAGAGKDISTLLKWDVSSIPAGSLVLAARITLNVTNRSNHSYQLYELKRPWVEGETSWNLSSSGSRWSVPGAGGSLDRGSVVLGTVNASALGSYSLTLNSSGVALVQSWVATPSTNQGLIITSMTSSDDLVFESRSTGTKANRPMLTVTYRP